MVARTLAGFATEELHEEPLPKVERAIELALSPTELWAHLVDGELASLWMGGMMEIEPRGNGRVSLETPGSPSLFGTVEEIEVGESIIWTWRTADGDPTQVTLRIDPTDTGSRLNVTEELLRYEIVFVPVVIG